MGWGDASLGECTDCTWRKKSKNMNQIYWCALKPVRVIELKFIVSQSVMVCSYDMSDA